MLEQNEAIELIQKAQNGDNLAKSVLVENNSPLIKSILRRYKNKGVEYDDLYQLGCIGLLKAIKNFSTEFGVKFSTYAVVLDLDMYGAPVNFRAKNNIAAGSLIGMHDTVRDHFGHNGFNIVDFVDGRV